MPYVNGFYKPSRGPQSPRRFAPRAVISQFGRLLQHDAIPDPRPDVPPRALSADLMNSELESYLHVREARDHALTASGKPRPAEPHLTYSTPERLLTTEPQNWSACLEPPRSQEPKKPVTA